MPAGWALPGALRRILVLPHPASRHVQAAQPCQPRSKPGLAPSAPSPALLCQVPSRGHHESPEEGTTDRAASRGLGRGAHGAWTEVRQRRGDTAGAPLPTAPAGASTSGDNEQVRTAPGNTAREEPQRLPHRPRPEQSPQSRFSLSRDLPGYSRRPSRGVQCERAPGEGPTAPSAPLSGTGRKACGGGDSSGDDKEDLGADGEDPSNDGKNHPQSPRAPGSATCPPLLCHSQDRGGQARQCPATPSHLSPTQALPGELPGWESTSGHVQARTHMDTLAAV